MLGGVRRAGAGAVPGRAGAPPAAGRGLDGGGDPANVDDAELEVLQMELLLLPQGRAGPLAAMQLRRMLQAQASMNGCAQAAG